jgi:hypothetical protein
MGGYRYQTATTQPDLVVTGASMTNSFAWQNGTGVTYQLSPRVTFDVGYRSFSVGNGSTPLLTSGNAGGGAPYLFFGNSTSAFTASELLLSIRIDEPFRGLIRWRPRLDVSPSFLIHPGYRVFWPGHPRRGTVVRVGKKHFTEEQLVFAVRQAESGTSAAEIIRKARIGE